MLNALVKNYREIMMDGMAGQGFEADQPAAPSVESSFVKSALYRIATEAQRFLEGSKDQKLKYATRVHVFNDIGMVKLEFVLNCLEMSALAVESLGLTYDNTLSVNLIYDPDVSSLAR